MMKRQTYFRLDSYGLRCSGKYLPVEREQRSVVFNDSMHYQYLQKWKCNLQVVIHLLLLLLLLLFIQLWPDLRKQRFPEGFCDRYPTEVRHLILPSNKYW